MQTVKRRRSFRRFVTDVKPSYQWYRHCEAIGAVLQQVADGRLTRVMILCPPRHGKSETASRLFAAYYLYRYPDRFVAITSYGADLAYTLSRSARDNYLEAGGTVAAGSAAVGHWETGKGGGLWAAGVGGAVTGKGFSLGIIDDPIKNAEEAASELVRAHHQEWYQSTFYTRQEPGGSIVLIQTRWHEMDLGGWLLSEEFGDVPERWHVLHLPAFREEPLELPAPCTREPDWRSEREALCPERYPAETLERIRHRIGAYYFSALYQGTPHPRDGSFFQRDWFKIVDAVPVEEVAGQRVRCWDLAASGDASADFTCGVRMARAANGLFYLEDVVRGRWTPHARDQVILQTAQIDGPQVAVWLEEEPGSAGKSQSAALIRMLAGFAVRVERPTGDKPTRAAPLAAQLEAGNVRLVRGAWCAPFIDEALEFPVGRHDDQIDAVSLAFNKLAGQRAWAIY